eukprot:8096938-Prorocentrum_lima.AAC.1
MWRPLPLRAGRSLPRWRSRGLRPTRTKRMVLRRGLRLWTRCRGALHLRSSTSPTLRRTTLPSTHRL